MPSYPPVVIIGVLSSILVATILVVTLVVTGHAVELSSPSVVIVLGFCSTALLTLLGIGGVHDQVVEVHQQVNSRLDELVKAAHAAGVVEGKATLPTPPVL